MAKIPASFWWKRLHSFAGFGLTIYLFFHLLTNAQSVLSENGGRFIHEVNLIHEIPLLKLVELSILGLPILIHAIFGVYYLRTGELNSFASDGTQPYLQYGRNRAYSWQRITSWILLVGLFGHIVHMRFIEYPTSVQENNQTYFALKIPADAKLQALSEKINVRLFTPQAIDALDDSSLAETLQNFHLAPGEMVAVTQQFGPASLLIVRQAFQSPLMVLLYTIFVLAACFHAFNGLWTFLISWGVTLKQRSQRISLYITTFLMTIVTFLGLVTIYATYFEVLR